MRVPLSWLKEYVDLPLAAEELAERLSVAGLEVDSISRIGADWDSSNLIVGRIASVRAHPNAERLAIVDLDTGGSTTEQVVTGSPNIFSMIGAAVPPDTKVAYARAGATLADPENPAARKLLKPAVLRGVASAGMLCSQRELGISDENSGVYLLDPSSTVGAPLRDVLADTILEIAILPDAARCLSLTGVAREVSAILKCPLHISDPPNIQAGNAAAPVRVTIADTQLAQRYMATVIRGVKIGESPEWIQRRLIRGGLKPINNVVDITNYVMLEWGEPSHAFDFQRLIARAGGGTPQITVRGAIAGETITTLDGVERKLTPGTLVVADSVSPIAIAGVMGGRDTEISPETRDVLLEVGSFDRGAVRRAAQGLKLSTEASYRFSRGIPQIACDYAARRLVQLLGEFAGGVIDSAPVDEYPVRQMDQVIYLTPGEVHRQLGLDLSAEEIESILRGLDFKVEAGSVGTWPDWKSGESSLGLTASEGQTLLRCVAPWYRLDARLPADLVEEIARMIGFDRLEPTLLAEEMPRVTPDDVFEFEEQLRDILTAGGLQETINYALTTPAAHAQLGVAGESPSLYVALANPLNSERTVLRRSMLVSAVENIARNFRFAGRMTTFEIGRVYLPEGREGALPLEERCLSIALAGAREPFNIHKPRGATDVAEPFDFYDLSGMVQALCRKCGLQPEDWQLVPRAGDDTFTARAADLMVAGRKAGMLGELNPFAQAKMAPIPAPIFLAEIQIAQLAAGVKDRQWTVTVNRFPQVIEDLAFIVAEEVLDSALVGAIQKSGGTLVTDIQLFDIYRGDSLPAGRKSMAYRIIYQHPDRALSESEVSAARKHIIEHVTKDLGGILRGE